MKYGDLLEGVKMQQQELIRTWENAWNSKNLKKMQMLYAESVYYRDATVPNGMKGWNNFRVFLQKLFDLYPESSIKVTEVKKIKQKNEFFVHWVSKIPNQIQGEIVTEIEGVTRLYTTEDGRISREESFYDRFPIVKDVVRLPSMAKKG